MIKSSYLKNKITRIQVKIDQDKLFEDQNFKHTSLLKNNQVKPLEEQEFKTIQDHSKLFKAQENKSSTNINPSPSQL